MEKPKLVYVTYIASPPEQVWHVLTGPELTGRGRLRRRAPVTAVTAGGMF